MLNCNLSGIPYMAPNEKVDMSSKQRFVIFCAALCNALAAVYTIFPLVRNHGYPKAQLRDLFPFVAERVHPANSLFLYATCYGTAVLIGTSYFLGAIVLRRLLGSSAVFNPISLLDGFLSLCSLIAIRQLTSVPQICAVHIAHLAIIAGAFWLARAKLSAYSSRLPQSGYAIFHALFSGLFFTTFLYLLAYGPLGYLHTLNLQGTLSYFWPLYGAIIAMLAAYYVFNACPINPKIRSGLLLTAGIVVDVYIVRSLFLFTHRNETAYFDASTIIGPTHDILLGKDIGVNVVSPYGFLNVYLFALYCKLFGVVDYYRGLADFVGLSCAIGYSAIYLLLRHYTRSLLLPILGIIFLVSTNFNYTHVPIYRLPESTLFRFGPFIPVLIALYFVESCRGKKLLEWILAAGIALSAFLLPEHGLYAMLTITAIVVANILFRRDWFYANFFAKICGCLIACAALFELYILSKHGQRATWPDLMYFTLMYGKYGLSFRNFESVGMWVLVPLVYLISLFIVVERLIIRDAGHRNSAWMFLSGMGSLMFVYFAGKQGWTDLVRIQMPAIILVVAAFSYALRSFQYRVLVSLGIYGLAAFAVALSWDANDRFGMRDHWLLTKPAPYSSEPPWVRRFFWPQENYTKFMQDVEAIKELVPPSQPLAIMSHMDTLFYVTAGRKSLFRNNFYAHFALESEMEQNANAIYSSQTQYFFVEHTNFQTYENLVGDHVRNILNYPINKFNHIRKLNFIDVYEVVR